MPGQVTKLTFQICCFLFYNHHFYQTDFFKLLDLGWVCIMSTQSNQHKVTQSDSVEPKSTQPQPHQHKVTQSDSVEPKSTQPHQHKVTLDWVGLGCIGYMGWVCIWGLCNCVLDYHIIQDCLFQRGL